MTDSYETKRRRLLKTGIGLALALPMGRALLENPAAAEELPHVGDDDPTAKALKYTHDATTVDEATRGGADRVCKTCHLFTGGDAEWGPCSLFPGKAVHANGWCTAWVKRA